MDFEQLIQSMTPEVHLSLKRAIELGKWPNGVALSQEQKETCMEAVIHYEHHFVDEKERVGYIDKGSKADGEICSDEDDDSQDVKPIKWS